MLERILLLLPLCVCVVYGDPICCAPPQWEGVEAIMTGSLDDEGHTAVTTGTVAISFDATGKRIHLVENIQIGDKTQQFTFLQLYNQNVQYTIQNATCTRSKVPAWTNQACVPGNATLVEKSRLGLKQSIEVAAYIWTEGNTHIALQVTTEGCVPVTKQATGSAQGVSFITGGSYDDITVGIKDSSVFDVPESCKHDYVAEVTNPRMIYRR